MNFKKEFLLKLMKKRRMTRKEIIDHLDIAISTLSYLIDSLKRNGFVRTTNVVYGRGRPYEIVELVENAWYGISMKIGRDGVRVVFFNSHMSAVEEQERRITKDYRNTEGYTKIILDLLGTFKDVKRMNCVGISASGVVKDGRILHSSIMNVDNLDLYSLITSIFPGSHVSIMNDVEALTNYEKHVFGGNNFLVINYGTGIGAAFFRNSNRKFFEFGHTLINPEGEKCYCGQRGCLETVASEYAVLKRFTGEDFSILDFIEYEEEKYRSRLENMRRLSSQHGEKVEKFYNESLKILSREIGNLIIILNPDKVSFYGEGIKSWMVEKMENEIKTMFSRFRLGKVEFHCRENIPYSWEIGALLDSVEKYLEVL